ncbi:DUF4408 domain-containing protein [Psidium guajava]|nr:DUF4408 domain-containing protein [Psidium guajava]
MHRPIFGGRNEEDASTRKKQKRNEEDSSAEANSGGSSSSPMEFDNGGSSLSPTKTNNGASSSLTAPTGNCYEVFLSFRGPDTRHGFTDHLYHGLLNAGIDVFRDDDELCQGQDIRPVLWKPSQTVKV